jgi:hypothetical protein
MHQRMKGHYFRRNSHLFPQELSQTESADSITAQAEQSNEHDEQ